MTTKEFVQAFYDEYTSLVQEYLSSQSPKTEVAALIQSLNCNSDQMEIVKKIVSGCLRDAFYAILLGIDGEASIGGRQEMYQLYDENGNELTNDEIESMAWELFHNSSNEHES